MATENTPSPSKPLDWDAALTKLTQVEQASIKLGKLDDGTPKPGCNPSFYLRNVINPLRAAASNEKERSAVLYSKIMGLQPEEPTVAKFFRPFVFKDAVRT